MRKQQSETKGDKLGVILLIIIFPIAAAFIFFMEADHVRRNSAGSSAEQSSQAPLQGMPPGLQGKINDHMKETYYKQEFMQVHVSQENELANEVGGPVEDPNAGVNRLTLDQENHAGKIVRDLEREQNSKVLRPPTPEERINSKLVRDQWVREYDERYKEEFVNQFIENARKDGVEIRVNDDLDVTGLSTFEVEKPVRIPQSTHSATPGASK